MSKGMENIKATLTDQDLWTDFDLNQNEMIITKSGRQMFPSLKVDIEGLNPTAKYEIIVKFVPKDNCRYKYCGANGWVQAGPEDKQSHRLTYQHPDSPSTGEFWMSQSIAFKMIRLTNTMSAPLPQVVLNSMHKYLPVIKIIQLPIDDYPHSRIVKQLYFPETSFIAVTAYQNKKITELKIYNNPFAKGFRSDSKAKRKQEFDEDSKRSDSDDLSSQENRPNTEAVNLDVETYTLSESSGSSLHSSPLPSSSSSSVDIYPSCLPSDCQHAIHSGPYSYYIPNYCGFPACYYCRCYLYCLSQRNNIATYQPLLPSPLQPSETREAKPSRPYADFMVDTILS